MSPGHPGGKEDGVCLLPEGRNVASASILLGRASGYGQKGTLTGPADVGINININRPAKSLLNRPQQTKILEKNRLKTDQDRQKNRLFIGYYIPWS